MAGLIWNKEAYSVCVREIDRQHEKLINLINTLHAAMKEGKSREVLKDILEEMASYTKYHFCTEEHYFCKFNYQEKEAHIIEHKAFTEKVEQFKKDFEAGSQNLTIEVFRFLNNWLDNHIKHSDKKYTPCFLDNGLN